MTRKEVLEQAIKCVCGEREQEYGSPENSFNSIARLWTIYLQSAHGNVPALMPNDVAMMMVLLKVARAASSGEHDDNYVDIAGYAACAAEIMQPYVPYHGNSRCPKWEGETQ